jgi:outer membrane protein OmpA-like peptidoglycan-associated protein/tetratricopeptide (TPR) repeat protein/YHS domain-containing protein
VIKKLSGIFFLSLSLTSFSQSINSYLTKAKNHVERGEYYLAAGNYLEALKIDSLNKKANLEYGLLNTQYINNPGKAGVYLLRSERLSKKDTVPELLLGLAQYYHHIGDYQKALAYYKRMFSKFEKKPESIQIENIILRSIANCEYALSNPTHPVFKKMRSVNAGEGVNTIYPEYSPVVTKDGKVLMFTTRRENNIGHKIDDADGNYFEDMYLARKGKDGNFKNSHPFSPEDPEVNGLNNTKGHEAVVSLSPNGDKFFTYRNNKLYESNLINNTWTAPVLMSTAINTPGGFQSHISMSAGGKTIYFSSERPGGSGGLDIYKSDLNNGNWSTPVNLGPTINTKEDDDSPFISYDGKTLYFASKGHPGYGAFDLFRSVFNGTEWSKPENLGTLFNSSGDDTHLSFNRDETGGVFSSSRSGGFGDMDIYEIKYEDPFENFKSDSLGRITVSSLPDTFFLNETATLGVSSNKLPPSAFKSYYWQINDSVLAANGEIVTYVFTRPGTARIRLAGLTTDNEVIGYEKKVVISDRVTGVATNTPTIGTQTTTVHTNTLSTVNTNASGASFENIYFNFDQYIINAEAQATLLKTLKILKDNPSLNISVSAYCDSRGPAEYNERLSQRRAKSAVWFLYKHGLDKKRIKTINWFGEKDPLNKCTDDTPCTTGEYRINRRVEFKIVK